MSEKSKNVIEKYEGSHSSQKDIPSIEYKSRVSPVVRLPVDTKIVMRMDAPGGVSNCGVRISNKGTSSCRRGGRKEDLAAKIDQVWNGICNFPDEICIMSHMTLVLNLKKTNLRHRISKFKRILLETRF